MSERNDPERPDIINMDEHTADTVVEMPAISRQRPTVWRGEHVALGNDADGSNDADAPDYVDPYGDAEEWPLLSESTPIRPSAIRQAKDFLARHADEIRHRAGCVGQVAMLIALLGVGGKALSLLHAFDGGPGQTSNNPGVSVGYNDPTAIPTGTAPKVIPTPTKPPKVPTPTVPPAQPTATPKPNKPPTPTEPPTPKPTWLTLKVDYGSHNAGTALYIECEKTVNGVEDYETGDGEDIPVSDFQKPKAPLPVC